MPHPAEKAVLADSDVLTGCYPGTPLPADTRLDVEKNLLCRRYGHSVHPPLTDVTRGCWVSASILDVRARATLGPWCPRVLAISEPRLAKPAESVLEVRTAPIRLSSVVIPAQSLAPAMAVGTAAVSPTPTRKVALWRDCDPPGDLHRGELSCTARIRRRGSGTSFRRQNLAAATAGTWTY
jgi:hypothetical protein